MTVKTATSDIARQHEEIRKVVDALPATTDLPVLIRTLRDLRDDLEDHFELEEGPDGFHDIVLERAPRHTTRVQRLFEEHRDFLRRIDAITEKARACLEGPLGEIFREVEAFTHALSRHEERENDMLEDAMYSDTGGGD